MGRFPCEGTVSATTADFMAILNVLQLQTVHFGAVSTRTIVVEPDASVARAGYYARDLEVEASVDPLLVVDFKDVRVDSGQHLILTEDHILVDDMDTRDPLDDTKVDASKIKFRITGLTGGTLWTRASDSDPWLNVAPTPSTQYQEFSLADLKAGKIAFLAGDGQSTGDGKTIDFSIQAVDDDLNLSDSDLSDDDADPIEVNIFIVATARTVAGIGARINTDGLLTPSPTTLDVWQGSARAYSGTLYVIVKLMGDLVDGDKLSLQGSYDTSEITPVWTKLTGELSLKIEGSATVEDIQTALGALWLDTVLATAASTREVWVFPTLGNIRYLLHETEEMVRHYFKDGTARSFSNAGNQAKRRSLFGKPGYMGVFTSSAEKTVYQDLKSGGIHLGITDTAREGKWVIIHGPRKGQVLWDHPARKFGPGAGGSDLRTQGHFWSSGEPNNHGGNEDYAQIENGGKIIDSGAGNRRSIVHFDLLLSEGNILKHKVNVVETPPNPILSVGMGGLRLFPGDRLVLTESHLSVRDVDTLDNAGNVDASKIKFRITGLTGAELHELSAPDTWTKIVPQGASPNAYQEFTLADLKARKISLEVGDGRVSGDGVNIAFQIQAVDDTPNLSDSNPDVVGDDPAEVEIVIVLPTNVASGTDSLINADHALTPLPATLGAWKASASTYSGTLHVVVKLMGLLVDGDTLSLRSGYDASKVTPGWTESTRELSLQFTSSATPADMRAALGKLSLDSTLSLSSSTRKIWIFPTLPGLNRLKYRLDESTGLVRYYYYDGTSRSFSAASTQAEGRTLFGKSGYLGVYTSDTEKSIYTGFGQNDIFLALSDDTTEGEWVITSGPRAGELLWDRGASRFGSGAQDPGWISRRDFWHGLEPNGGSGENYAKVDSNGRVYDIGGGNRKSVTQFDLLLSEGGFITHKLLVAPVESNPVLEVDFSEVLATSERYLELKASWFSVTDADTVLGDGSIDADNIELRITNIPDDTLYVRASVSDTAPWTKMDKVISQDYYSFTLAQLQGRLVALVPDAAGTFTFDIQAVDAQGNLSDSDETDSDFDPVSVSISVIALKEIDAGKKMPVNDDHALTPDDTTLDAWTAAMVADNTLRIFVRLRHGKDGIVTMDEGVVAEGLSLASHGVPSSNIVIDWSENKQELSLKATSSTVAADLRAILGALELQTVHFGTVSHRTIEVEAEGSVARATYYVREVEVSASPPNPFMKVDFGKERMMSEQRLMLNENHIEVVDPDTVLVDGSVDASNITLRVTNLSGGKLEKFSSNTWTEITSSPLEFTLEELRNGLVSFLADPSNSVSALAFDIQAVDPQGNLSDSDESDDDADPVSVSVPVIPLKEIDAGKKMRVNDDHALTPDDTTLGAWILEVNTPTIFVELKDGKRWSGARKVVQEQLFSNTHSIADSKIAISWDANNWRLVLEGSSTAAVGDFKAVLDALELQTVRFATASERTISVRPDLQVEVDKQDYYARDVLVRASGSMPYVGVQEFSTLRFGDDDRAILLSSEFFVEDFDSSAADITIVMTELLAGATLQKRDNAGSYSDIIAPLEFTLAELQQGLIAIYMPSALGKKITFELKAKDEENNWNDVGTGNTFEGGVRAFELDAVLGLSSEALEVDVQTGYQRAVPFGGLKGKIETVRGDTSRDGALRITLENATPGDRLVMRKSVTGIAGAWSDRGHVYTLTVSDTISSEDIDTAVSEVYYRASEVAGEQVRRVLVHWVDNSGGPPALLYEVSLYNRPPVLRNWGLGAMYHDITPAPGATEASLELGYHPYSEYMPEVLDNEGRVVRLEVVLVDKDGDVLSADERVFLSKLLREQAQAGGLVVRELRSSDRKARALVIEVADEKTFVSPAFMSRFLQGLAYRHGPSGGTLDLGERRRISVSVFDGQSHTRTHEMEVRLVDTLPNPARYVNTFIGTAKQSGMGVSQGTGNTDNEAGMTFPGAAYPFGAVRLTPATGQSPAYGGYRDDKSLSSMKFVVTAFSGPGCKGAEAGESTGGFSVGVGSSETKNADKSSQESEAGYYEVLLRGGGNEVLFEAAASSPRTSTMRLTYQNDAATGFVRLPGSVTLSEREVHWVVTYNTSEEGICSPSDTSVDSGLFVSMHIGQHQVRAVTKSGNDIQFELKSGHRAVDIKLSISYVSREGASRNIDVENPGWPAFEVQKEKAGKAWNYYLSKVAIDKFQDDDHDKTEQLDKWSIFYSALYRSLLHMNTASDVDGNYKGIGDHNKNVRDAPSYGYDADPGTEGSGLKVYFTNFSGWDVYRSQMSLVGLVAPALSQDMAISLLESAYVDGTANYPQGDREIPRSTTGYHETSEKFGDPGPPSVSSLFMFGSQSVSLHGMLEVFDKSRTARAPSDADAHHILEGVASDAAIAQMALWMSQQDSFPEALREKARSLYENARARTDRALNLLDTSGYSKRSESSIADDKESHYTQFSEGNSIQYTFMNTHNVLGLKQKIDDGEAALPLLTRLLISQPAVGGSSAYSTLLGLSKTEGLARWDAPNNERSMAIRFLTHFLKPNEGQGSWYAFMGNEVGHSSPFLANWFEPHLTQNAARRISLFGFRNAAGGLYGNDDLGATSAWYVWTAMGLYPVIPGVGGVTLVAPRFAHVEISVPGGKSVKLRSSSASGEEAYSEEEAYIQSLERDGRKTSSLWLTASELLRGVELDFQVGASKSSWGEDTPDAPPSYGETEKDLSDLLPAVYGSIWRDEGDDSTGASSHSAFDGDHNTAWRFVSESDGSKVLEVDFTSVYAASGLLLRHAEVGRTSTLNSDLSNVTVSVWVKDADGSWKDAVATRGTDHDARRMLLDFAAERRRYTVCV